MMIPLRQEIMTLSADWCDGLLVQQIDAPTDSRRHGGLLCPDCGIIHGRCGDALYGFLRRARETGDDRWIRAAIAVQNWTDNVSNNDGSFRNEVEGNHWTGITVFAVLSLGEALHHHGDLLPDATRAKWMDRLAHAAHWVRGVDWANHGTINYPVSAAAALACASRVLHDDTFLDTARHWGAWVQDYFLPDGILIGEGIRDPTVRGIYAVDAAYNLEESLPNLALYADIAGDSVAQAIVLRSFEAHLDFLLPDGSLDAGWCSRSFKWTLWGSRTSDGIAGLLPYSRFDPRIAEATWRNIVYLRSCTTAGLLYGGPHLKAQQRAPCIHHTFTHAKALAAALDGDYFIDGNCSLPNDAPQGIRTRPALGTTFVSLHQWRASFTVSDVFYGAVGSHASGGAMTMLWHGATGPLCVSSMSRYTMIEGRNMATPRTDQEITVLTPRLESDMFSSIFDERAILQTDADSVIVTGNLTNGNGETAGTFRLATRFADDFVHFRASGNAVRFLLPIASPVGEVIHWSQRRIEIRKPHATVICESSDAISGDSNRVFHFVPGIQAVLLEIAVSAEGTDVFLRVEPPA